MDKSEIICNVLVAPGDTVYGGARLQKSDVLRQTAGTLHMTQRIPFYGLLPATDENFRMNEQIRRMRLY